MRQSAKLLWNLEERSKTCEVLHVHEQLLLIGPLDYRAVTKTLETKTRS